MTVETQPDGSPSLVDREEAYCSACGQSFPPDLATCPTDGARLIKLGGKQDAVLGRVFEGRYEVRSKLGAGGMGTVYRGWQLSVDREVAIKVIDPRLSSDRTAVKRFLREARLASRLSQPTIVNVYDFGQTEDGICYIVMELLKGHTLGQEQRGQPWGVRRACHVIAQLCDALESAHAQGIIHRDLKPGNIIVLDDPPGRDLIKVLDFGLAKSLTGDIHSRVTKTDTVLGTPLYMSPEQIDGKPSDQRGDLYSVGCMFYELLVGQPPFNDPNMHALLARHMSEPPPALPAHVPAPIAELVARMLAKRPELRVQSAGEVRRAIMAAGGTGGDSLPPSTVVVRGPVRGGPVDVQAATAASSMSRVPRPQTSRVGYVALAIGAVTLFGGLGFLAYARSLSGGAVRGEEPVVPFEAPIKHDAAVPAMAVDAGVPAVVIDASVPAAVVIDAGQVTHPHPHPRPRPVVDAAVAAPPVVPVDAGVPSLEFVKIDAGR